MPSGGREPRVCVSNAELFTVREAMRGLNRIVDRIEAGDLDKAVLMRGGRMVAVVTRLGREGGG